MLLQNNTFKTVMECNILYYGKALDIIDLMQTYFIFADVLIHVE